MTLLIDIDCDKTTGWEGYDCAINRKRPNGSEATLEKNQGKWSWSETGKVAFRVKGNRMELAISRAMLDLSSDRPVDIEFKWTDNLPASGDIMDFYSYGDVAPSGRFNYRYHTP